MVAVAVLSAPARAAASSGLRVATAAPTSRVLVLSLPDVVWSDLDLSQMPNLDRVLDTAAVANLSTRAPSLEPDLASGYATFGAGDKAVASESPGDGAAFGVDEVVDGQAAADVFATRTGVLASRGLVHLGAPVLEDANARSLWRARLGALGDALGAAGYSRAVIANSDGADAALGAAVPQRAAVTALMGADGTVPAGEVSAQLLQRDPAAPYGVRLDAAAVVHAFTDVWGDHSVVLVEASDLVRADAYAAVQSAPARAASLQRALAWTDDLIGRLLDRVAGRDAVVVVGPTASRRSGGLTVAAVRAPGVEPGLLRSGTTQRAGYVQLMDVAPTILQLAGVDRPATMRGRPFTVATTTATTVERRAELVDGNDAASFRDMILTPVAVVFVALVAVLLLGVVATMRKTRRHPRDRAPTPVVLGALATLGYVVAVYLARLVPFHRIGPAAYYLFLFAVAACFAVLVWLAARRRPMDALIVGLAALVALLVGDVVLGSSLQFDSAFGFSPEIAGRFIGFGNVSYAVLASASVLLAGLLAHRIPGLAGRCVALAVLGVAIVADGAPFWGADVGGVLTMVPAFVLAAVLLFEIRVRARTLMVAAASTVGAIALAVTVDLLRPAGQRTHLGRLVEQVNGEGSSAFLTVVHRKLDMSLSTLSSSQWRPMVPVVLGFVAFLYWWPPHRLRHVLRDVGELRAVFVSLAVVAVLGFALNDQGIVVPAVMLGVLAPVLVVLAGDATLTPLTSRSTLPIRPGGSAPQV